MRCCSLRTRNSNPFSSRKLRKLLFFLSLLTVLGVLWKLEDARKEKLARHEQNSTRFSSSEEGKSRNVTYRGEDATSLYPCVTGAVNSTNVLPWKHQNGVEKPSGFVGVVEPRALVLYSRDTRIYKLLLHALLSLRMQVESFSVVGQATWPKLLKTEENGPQIGLFSHVFVVGLNCLSLLDDRHRESLFDYLRRTHVVMTTTYDTLDDELSEEDLNKLSLVALPNSASTSSMEVGVRMHVMPKSVAHFISVLRAKQVVRRIPSNQIVLLMRHDSPSAVPVVCVEGVLLRGEGVIEVGTDVFDQVSSITKVTMGGVGVLYDNRADDEIRRVTISLDLSLFPLPLLLFDIIVGLSPVPILPFHPLRRYLLIDVDDVFHATSGHQLTKQHVMNVLKFQEDTRERHIKNFHLNLGFVGSLFNSAKSDELEGNRLLIENKHEFWWFPHTFGHEKAHEKNREELQSDMRKNRDFAKKHGLHGLVRGYSVAPFHSGVFPVHPPLYDVWREVWNVTVTTTEEYPHLYPAHSRRGFVYRGLHVLPRQTCGIFTSHTFFTDDRNLSRLFTIAEEEVFYTILYNPVSVFMTHFNNYGGDQLAIKLFSHLFSFISKWTNLELVQQPPLSLANLYFTWYPKDTTPVWTSPCEDKRHRSIWPVEKNCSRLPSLVILGPQKSGSTALHFFLQAHPLLLPSLRNPEHFEEVQFFSNKDVYLRGIDWYMDQFPNPQNGNVILYEKSATYFDSEVAPQRMYSLLPKANIVVILTDPIRRAYSWYQHILAHNSEIAKENTFYKVLNYSGRDQNIISLRKRCLEPGLYSKYLQNWLKYYPRTQLHIVDGDDLVNNPVKALSDLQRFLKPQVEVDFEKFIKYENRKGFFCKESTGEQLKCLGPGKGRGYRDMSSEEKEYLRSFYRRHNEELSRWLRNRGYQEPKWLLFHSNE